MKWRYLIMSFIAGIAFTVAIIATFFSFKTTRNLGHGSYTFNWDQEDNVFVENADQTLSAHINAWGDESTWDEITAYRLAPNGDLASTGLTLAPDGFKLSVAIKKNNEEYFLFDDDGDGFFERMGTCCPDRQYKVTYTLEELEINSNQPMEEQPIQPPRD